MIRIAIAEDEAAYRTQLGDYITQYATESNHQITTTFFTDGDELVEQYRSQFDIVLLDIEMTYMDGMTAAREIRRVDPEVVIIFITNMAQYAIRGYEVNAFDYVLKPVSYFAFSQRLGRAISRMKKREKSYLSISLRGGAQKLEIDRILRIESEGHNLTFCTLDETVTASGTIKDLEERLSAEGFFRCNKGALVNLNFVTAVQDGCAIIKGNAIPISRARKPEFLQALAAHIGEVVK